VTARPRISRLPWLDEPAFAAKALALAADRHARAARDPAFLDRGTTVTRAWHDRGGTPLPPVHARGLRAHRRVFLAPPRPALSADDEARRHDRAAAEAEDDALSARYPAQGDSVAQLPRLPVESRPDGLPARLSRA
jgi:predicted ATPase